MELHDLRQSGQLRHLREPGDGDLCGVLAPPTSAAMAAAASSAGAPAAAVSAVSGRAALAPPGNGNAAAGPNAVNNNASARRGASCDDVTEADQGAVEAPPSAIAGAARRDSTDARAVRGGAGGAAGLGSASAACRPFARGPGGAAAAGACVVDLADSAAVD